MARTREAAANQRRSAVSGLLSRVYAAATYLVFLAVAAYAIAFLADAVVPRTVDRGGPQRPVAAAVAVDMVLLGLFAVQHSVMARSAFKRWWARLVPPHLERATYVLLASATLVLLFWGWHPIPTVVWDVDAAPARAAVWVLYALGWALVVAMTFAIDHFEFLGLRQVARRLRGEPPAPPELRTPLPYRLVRHPLMTGFIIAFLATPTMTAGHLLFAALGCGYILVGVRLEERDLANALPEYSRHAATLPRFFPSPRRRAR